MLRCQGFEVKHYDFTLGRLAYGSLRPVQDPGIQRPQNLNSPTAIPVRCILHLLAFGTQTNLNSFFTFSNVFSFKF